MYINRLYLRVGSCANGKPATPYLTLSKNMSNVMQRLKMSNLISSLFQLKVKIIILKIKTRSIHQKISTYVPWYLPTYLDGFQKGQLQLLLFHLCGTACSTRPILFNFLCLFFGHSMAQFCILPQLTQMYVFLDGHRLRPKF